MAARTLKAGGNHLIGLIIPDIINPYYPQIVKTLEDLALKARFSQHTLTSEELYRFEQFRTQILTTADGLPWYRKIWLRWILAIL